MQLYNGSGTSAYQYDMNQWLDPVRMGFRRVKPKGFNHVGYFKTYWRYLRRTTDKTYTTVLHGAARTDPKGTMLNPASMITNAPFLKGYRMFSGDPTVFD